MNIEPGLRTDLSNDEYHGLTEWLSSSQLKAALPEHYTKPAGDSPALAFGTFFHSLVLEPDTVSDLYVPLDAEKIGVKADGSPAQNPTMTNCRVMESRKNRPSGPVSVAKKPMMSDPTTFTISVP